MFFAAAGMFGFYDYQPPAEKLQEFFNDNPTNLYYSGYLGLLSAVFLMWFAGSIYKTLRKNEGGEGRLALVAFGGCLASGIGIALGYSVVEIISGLAGAESGISPMVAVLLNQLYGTFLVGLTGISMAVFIGATSVVSLRTSMFPVWFGWVSALVAIGLLTPLSFIVLGFAMLWLFGVSIWLYIKGASAANPSPVAEAAWGGN
jgi:hypothetical protein